MQGVGELYVGLLAATILFIATNAGIIGVSRLVYSMGIHRQVPDRLRQLHPRYGTPWIGILVFGAIACLTMIPGQADFLGNMYAFGAMLSFTIAHLAVIRLRVQAPGRARPYRGPGAVRIRGHELPLFAVVGGLGTALAFVVVTRAQPRRRRGRRRRGWRSASLFYVVYRRRQGLDLTTTTKVAVPQPVTEPEAEYESVLVALEAAHYSRGAIATAAKLAAQAPARHPRARDDHRPAVLADRRRAARAGARPRRRSSSRRSCRAAGASPATGEKVRAGQAGRLIVDEARELRARAIVMPLPPRSAATSLFGKTVETVLAERPCRVIIETEPAATRDGARRPARTPCDCTATMHARHVGRRWS